MTMCWGLCMCVREQAVCFCHPSLFYSFAMAISPFQCEKQKSMWCRKLVILGMFNRARELGSRPGLWEWLPEFPRSQPLCPKGRGSHPETVAKENNYICCWTQGGSHKSLLLLSSKLPEVWGLLVWPHTMRTWCPVSWGERDWMLNGVLLLLTLSLSIFQS